VSEVCSMEGVHLERDGRSVLAGTSLAVRRGEVLGLVGPSGSGKTTLLRVLLGLEALARGVIRLAGAVVTDGERILVPPERRDLAVIFQDLALWPHLTVEENLDFGLRSRHVPPSERRRRIAGMLDSVGLLGRAQSHPAELSGGEQQRIAIARALVLEPCALLLDEPLTNLDVELKASLGELLRQLLRDRRMAAIYVMHDLREGAALCDRFAVLERGVVIQEGGLAVLQRQPATPFVERLVADLARHW
jgi:ABC-type Fe3+/spermidine/putrescine transport system ATPase subunit